MQSQFFDNEPIEVSETEVKALSNPETTRFHCHFEDSMEMYAEVAKVADYLDVHQGWFCDCAHPMKVEPIGVNSYALVIGRFGAFGYEVEPKIGLELLPADGEMYKIRTVPVPDYVPPGYDVDYRATMHLVEKPMDSALAAILGKKIGNPSQLPQAIAQVNWELDLEVKLQFPKFIHKLSQSLIQSTGDRLLLQIVRQVSRRLTQTVQEDFHTKLGLPVPKKAKKR